jgi:hypothetical protein
LELKEKAGSLQNLLFKMSVTGWLPRRVILQTFAVSLDKRTPRFVKGLSLNMWIAAHP